MTIMTNDTRDELISAALDGEVVDIAALRDALATPDGQRALAAFVLLRAEVAADGSSAADRLPVPLPRTAIPFVGRPWRRLIPTAAAASLGALALAGSFWLGTTWTARDQAAPPVKTAVASPASTTEEQPPTPTRRLEYIPGVDWQAGS